MFDWLDRSANVSSHELRRNSINHSLLSDNWVVNEKINVGLRQVDTSCAGAENENFGLRVDFLNDGFDAVDNFLSPFLLFLAL